LIESRFNILSFIPALLNRAPSGNFNGAHFERQGIVDYFRETRGVLSKI
jgi:hypothetical protein